MEFAKIKLKPVHSQLRHRANSGAGFPLHPEIHNTVSRNDPAAPQDHCGKSRNRTQDLCPRSLACLMSHHISRRYHISATKFESNKNCFQQVIFSTNAWVRRVIKCTDQDAFVTPSWHPPPVRNVFQKKLPHQTMHCKFLQTCQKKSAPCAVKLPPNGLTN